jgi:hypothetical protein
MFFTNLACSLSSGRALLPQLCFLVSPLKSALPRVPGSAHSNRLPEKLSPLESALLKNRGEGVPPSSDSFVISLFRCLLVSTSVVLPLEPCCIATANALYPASFHIVAGLFPLQQGGYPPPVFPFARTVFSSFSGALWLAFLARLDALRARDMWPVPKAAHFLAFDPPASAFLAPVVYFGCA